VAADSRVSVHLARVGADRPAFVLDEHALHLTASTMKLVVLIVYLRAVGLGSVDPDLEIAVHKDFPSSDGIHRFDVIEEQEDDLEPLAAGARAPGVAGRADDHPFVQPGHGSRHRSGRPRPGCGGRDGVPR